MLPSLLICLVILQSNPPPTLQRTIPLRGNASIGQVVMLGVEGQVLRQTQTFAVVATTPEYLAEQVKRYLAGDQEGIEDLTDKQRLLEITTGTKAKVVAKDFAPYQNAKVPFYQVKLLEGRHKDKTVCVIPSFLITTQAELTAEAKEQKKKEQAAQALENQAGKPERDKETAERYATIKLNVAKKYQKEGDKELAIRYLRELLRLYPDAQAAGEAKELLKGLTGK